MPCRLRHAAGEEFSKFLMEDVRKFPKACPRRVKLVVPRACLLSQRALAIDERDVRWSSQRRQHGSRIAAASEFGTQVAAIGTRLHVRIIIALAGVAITVGLSALIAWLLSFVQLPFWPMSCAWRPDRRLSDHVI
jgi:hypothetical protein